MTHEISKIFSFDINDLPRSSELEKRLSQKSIEELKNNGILTEQEFELTCSQTECFGKTKSVYIEKSLYKICDFGHKFKLSFKDEEENKIYSINYGLLIEKIFSKKLVRSKPLMISFESFDCILVPGDYSISKSEIAVMEVLKHSKPVCFFFYDKNFYEYFDFLSNLIPNKILVVALIEDFLKNEQSLLDLAQRKINFFQSAESLYPESTKKLIETYPEIKDIISNSSAFLGYILNSYHSKNWKKFEDLVKLLMCTLTPTFTELGGEKPGSETPDALAILLNEDKPYKRVLLDCKSLISETKDAVNIPPSTSNKYNKYISYLKELDKRQGKLPAILLFIAPSFRNTKIAKEIYENNRDSVDICFLDLYSLAFLYFVFSSPILKKEINLRDTKQSLLLDILTKEKFYAITKKTKEFEFHYVTLEDTKEILKVKFGKSPLQQKIFEDFQDIIASRKN